MPKMTLKAELEKLAQAQHHNPYEILGKYSKIRKIFYTESGLVFILRLI